MEWIKCSERLPKNNEYVLVWDSSYIFISKFVQTTDKRHKIRSGYFEDNHGYMNIVTHWMPLPELPPKNEEEQ